MQDSLDARGSRALVPAVLAQQADRHDRRLRPALVGPAGVHDPHRVLQAGEGPLPPSERGPADHDPRGRALHELPGRLRAPDRSEDGRRSRSRSETPCRRCSRSESPRRWRTRSTSAVSRRSRRQIEDAADRRRTCPGQRSSLAARWRRRLGSSQLTRRRHELAAPATTTNSSASPRQLLRLDPDGQQGRNGDPRDLRPAPRRAAHRPVGLQRPPQDREDTHGHARRDQPPSGVRLRRRRAMDYRIAGSRSTASSRGLRAAGRSRSRPSAISACCSGLTTNAVTSGRVDPDRATTTFWGKGRIVTGSARSTSAGCSGAVAVATTPAAREPAPTSGRGDPRRDPLATGVARSAADGQTLPSRPGPLVSRTTVLTVAQAGRTQESPRREAEIATGGVVILGHQGDHPRVARMLESSNPRKGGVGGSWSPAPAAASGGGGPWSRSKDRVLASRFPSRGASRHRPWMRAGGSYEFPESLHDPLVAEPGAAASGRMSRQRRRDTGPRGRTAIRAPSSWVPFRVHVRPVRIQRKVICLHQRRIAGFVDGCFWHGCPRPIARIPKRNVTFWFDKIEKNRLRDAETDRLLTDAGWLGVRVWEHEQAETAADRVEDRLVTVVPLDPERAVTAIRSQSCFRAGRSLQLLPLGSDPRASGEPPSNIQPVVYSG